MKEYFCIDAKVNINEYDCFVGMLSQYGISGIEELKNDEDSVIFRIYFTDRELACLTKDKLKKNLCGDITIVNTNYEEWIEKWRSSIKPVELKEGWWVSPLWRPPISNIDHNKWIKIEPKMAFGTGHHESTRLAAQVIIEEEKLIKGKKILDIGTGSGILSFISDKVGAKWCVGIEIDKECLENLSENRELNFCKEKCSFVIGSVESLKEKNIKFDIIVMNMIHMEAAPLLSRCKSFLSKNGILIWSGILREQKDISIDFAKEKGFILEKELTENEWWCGSFYPSTLK